MTRPKARKKGAEPKQEETGQGASQVVRDPKTGVPLFAVVPIAQYEEMREAAEELEELAAARAVDGRIARGEEELYPFEVVSRLVDGENPVRVFREHRSLTQAALARRAGLRQATVSDIEAGALGNVATFARLARALSVDIEELLPREQDS